MIKVGVISPSGALNEDGISRVNQSIEYLKNLGFEPVMGKHVFEKHRYMAGSAENRAEDIMDFFKNPEIKAILCTRGGAGSQFVLPLLDYEIIKANPKPIFGFSDTTALQLGIWTMTENLSYTGFCMAYNFKDGNLNPYVDETFRKIIKKEPCILKSGETLVKGKASGVLVGGCLSLIHNLCGTKYFPNLKDKILLIEDVGEQTYKIEWMLQTLTQQPDFDKVKGIVFGKFVDCNEKDNGDGTIDEILNDFCKDLKIPVIKNFAYSHSVERYVLPIGQKVELNADNKELQYGNF